MIQIKALSKIWWIKEISKVGKKEKLKNPQGLCLW